MTEIKPNLIDRVVGYINPIAGVRRMHAHAVMAMAESYLGASKSRRQTVSWRTGNGNPDADILPDLPTLRERSRDLLRNAPLALGAINTKVTNVVGTGLKLQSRIDRDFLKISDDTADQWERQAEREFKLWAESTYCDAEQGLSFYSLQALAFRSVLENGDVFVLLPSIPRNGCPYDLRIQLIEADRVSQPMGSPERNDFAGGVQKTAEGAPVAYYFQKTHPGAKRPVYEWTAVSAYGQLTGRRNVLHLFNKLRPGQTRGVPDLAPVIETLKQLDKYTEAEIMGAVISSMFAVFIKSPNGDGLDLQIAGETGQKSADKDFKLAPGMVVSLAPGEDITTSSSNRPNQQFDPFMQAVLRQVGVALELPFEVLIKHFTASYSASRAALLEAWKFFSKQRQWLAEQFCQPIYEAWLHEAVALGRIAAPGFLNGDPSVRQAYLGAEWVGPARGQIDEKKEVEAAMLRVDAGFTTRGEETSQLTGGDWEQKHHQRAKEERMRREAGLDIPILLNNQSAQVGSNTDD